MMEKKYYTGEQILEALSEVGVGAGDTSEVQSYLDRLPSAELNVPDINVGDMISRQDAIDAIDGLPNCYNGFSDSYDKSYIIGVLEELPSAEPEIIHCRDCKYYDGRPCGIVDYYNTESDFCSRAERRTNEAD